MDLTKEEVVFLINLLGNIDGHLIRHILRDSIQTKELDIDNISMNLYLKLQKNTEI